MPYFPTGYFPTGASSAPSPSGQLRYKPHTLTLYAYAGSNNAQGVVLPAGDGASLGSIACQITTKTPSVAMDKYGVECTNPYLVLCEIADTANVKINQKVTATLGGIAMTFRVKTKPQIHAALTGTQHASFLMEQVERI